MDSPCIKQTVCKVLKIFQYGKYLVAYVLKISLRIYTPRLPPDIILIYLLLLLSSTRSRLAISQTVLVAALESHAHWILVQKKSISFRKTPLFLITLLCFNVLKPSHDFVPLFCLLTHIQHCNEGYRNIRHPHKICFLYKKVVYILLF